MLCSFLDKIIFHHFTLNLEKCQVLRTSVQLLGKTVGRQGISPTPNYVQRWPISPAFARSGTFSLDLDSAASTGVT